jgi:hypothetical protein
MKNARTKPVFMLVAAACVFALAGHIAAYPAQSAKPSKDTFDWSAEFVALDENAKTMTVKASAVGEAVKQLSGFKAGDKLLLNWSGYDKYADAVNGASKYDAVKKPDLRFSFPAEFVAVDATRGNVTFKVAIPAGGMSRLKSVKAGEWVTATSPHGAASHNEPIAAVRGYNDPAPAS